MLHTIKNKRGVYRRTKNLGALGDLYINLVLKVSYGGFLDNTKSLWDIEVKDRWTRQPKILIILESDTYI